VSGLVTGGASDGTWTPNGLEFTETTTKNKIIQSAVTTADGVDTVTFTYIIAAKKTVGDKVVLFDTLHTDVNADKWTNEAIAAIDGMVITVDAYAVQAEGFTGDDAAATALHAAFADIF
ncbi:MAG: hypothetical protein IJL27_04470, partial [Firmicutes bacterium]|nr:hypothetical protein [Bacillota bacterium]